MTIKQMFKKIENYNAMTEEFGLMQYTSDEKSIEVSLYTYGGWTMMEYAQFKTYDAFAKYIKDRYFDLLAKAILNTKDYKFNDATLVAVEDGVTITMYTVVINVR